MTIKKKMKGIFKGLWGKGPIMERNKAFMLVALFLYVFTIPASPAALVNPIKFDSNSTLNISVAVKSGSIKISVRGM